MPTSKPSSTLVAGVRVDLEALRGLAHRCVPSRCRSRDSCCSSYEVLVDRRERRRITGYLGEAARYATSLRDGEDYEEPFEGTEGGSCLATDEEGRCLFAFRTRRAPVLCSLHAAALDLGLRPQDVKPMACAIWPLFWVESEPPLLTVQEDVARFPCNSRRPRYRTGLDPGVAGILRDVWGAGFLEAIERAL